VRNAGKLSDIRYSGVEKLSKLRACSYPVGIPCREFIERRGVQTGKHPIPRDLTGGRLSKRTGERMALPGF